MPLVEVTDGTSGQRHVYAYGPGSRLVGKTVDVDGAAAETRYRYCGNVCIEETDGLGTTTATYVRVGGKCVQVQSAFGVQRSAVRTVAPMKP